MLAVALLGPFGAHAAESTETKALPEMTLEELLKVSVSAGTLMGTERGKVPATITTISQTQIQDSGARDLMELLEIYVPNELYLRHNWEGSHIGLRGVISDRENKYLLVVNGKVQNELTHAGVVSERDLMTLGDIQEIRVVRGPGSAVYGAGALIGVVEIKTFDGKTFQGAEATVKTGTVEEFYTMEMKYGRKLADDVHLFIYGGVTHRVGVNNGSSPIIPGISGSSWNGPVDFGTGLAASGQPVNAGQPAPYDFARDKRDYRGLPPLKFHAELTLHDWELWARYTRGGEVQDWDQHALATHGFPWVNGGINGPGWWWVPFVFPNQTADYGPAQVGYQQLSGGADFKHEFNERWQGSLRLGYDLTDYERWQLFQPTLLDAHAEQKYFVRTLATWTSSDAHSLAFGYEFERGLFGLRSPGFPGTDAIFGGGPMERWATDTHSLLAEDRWDINSRWALFSGLRVDKNDYTDYMLSPRVAAIYTPTRKDTFKLIASQAVKANFAEELRSDHLNLNAKGETEKLRSLEGVYSRLLNPNWSASVNTFYHNYKVIGYDTRSTVVGVEDTVGIEFETEYHTDSLTVGLSHGYTTLLDFRHPSPNQAITAQPYGYGSDLNHWSAHITKVQWTYRPIDRLRLTGSLRVFWGFPGSEDYLNYANAAYYGTPSNGSVDSFVTDPSSYNPYNHIQLRLNLGVN